MKVPVYKRILAYVIDIVIITIIASLFSNMKALNPYLEEYSNVTEEYTEYVSSSEDLTIILDSEEYNNYLYEVSLYGVYTSIITLVVTVLYFVIFQYYNDGKTVGKALMNIKIENSKNKKLSLINLTIRSLLLDGIIISIIEIIMLCNCTKEIYLKYDEILQMIYMAFIIISLVLMILREDGRGLHDLIANTRVVSTNKSEDNIKEANVEEKETKEDKKPVKKRKTAKKATKKKVTKNDSSNS